MFLFSEYKTNSMANQSRFNNPYVDVVFSHFKIKEELCDTERIGIRWISLADRSLDEMVEVVKKAIRDQNVAKNILVICLQKFAGGTNATIMRRALIDIKEEVAKQRVNKVIFGTAYFVPSHELVWPEVAQFNVDVAKANDAMNMPRATIHKSVMCEVDRQEQGRATRAAPGRSLRRIKGAMWSEWQLGLGLGNHLSYEGMNCLIKYIMTIFDKSFCRNRYRPVSQDPELQWPQSLNITAGYCDNVFFKQVMAAKLIITRPLPEGERRLSHSERRPPAARYWRVFKDHGRLERFQQKEGLMEAFCQMWKQSDEDPVWAPTVEEEVEEVPANDVVVEEVEVIEINDGDEGDYVMVAPNHEPVREVFDHDENIEPEKVKEKNFYEDFVSAQNEVKKMDRKLKVATETTKAYKKDIEAKEAEIVKEKALTRHWKSAADRKEKEKDGMVVQYQHLLDQVKLVDEECKRITKEYEFLRNIYEAEGRKEVQKRNRVTRHGVVRKYVKDKDLKKHGKNDK